MVSLKKLKKELFLWWMLIFIPISLFCAYYLGNNHLTFITSLLAIVPLSQMMGFATQNIAAQANPKISGLFSATFGNLVELIIAVNALRLGMVRVVQASIVGSIISNILLLIGLSIFFGGLKFKHQQFNKQGVGVSSTMLIIVAAGLAMPSVYALIRPDSPHIQQLSNLVAMILAFIYLAGLVFALRTHKEIYDTSESQKVVRYKPMLTLKSSALLLMVTIVLSAIESELLVREISKVAMGIGMTETFIGLVIVAILTNIAEISTAIGMATKNRLNEALELGLSSANQMALFVAPILVIVSQLMNKDFPLVFTLFEVVALMLGVLIVNDLAADGRCNWLEGAQLMAVYFIIAVAFFFV